MKDKAQKLIEKYEELESELGNPEVLGDQARYNKIHKQYKGIEKAVLKAKEYLQMMDDLDEYKAALGDSDPEMVAMAKAATGPRAVFRFSRTATGAVATAASSAVRRRSRSRCLSASSPTAGRSTPSSAASRQRAAPIPSATS